MAERAPTIPPEEKRLLDLCGPDREGIYRAWQYGRLYGRSESWRAIADLPPVFGEPEIKMASPDEGEAA